MDSLHFIAHTIRGSGRGKELKVPTINLELSDVPPALNEGIYACVVTLNNQRMMGAMHYGPRTMFGDTPSCEVHLIDHTINTVPETIEMDVLDRIRDVQEFASVQDLLAQIDRDIKASRAILAAHGFDQSEKGDS